MGKIRFIRVPLDRRKSAHYLINHAMLHYCSHATEFFRHYVYLKHAATAACLNTQTQPQIEWSGQKQTDPD